MLELSLTMDLWINDDHNLVTRPKIMSSSSMNLTDFKFLIRNLANKGPIRADLNAKFNAFVEKNRLNFENDFLKKQLQF